MVDKQRPFTKRQEEILHAFEAYVEQFGYAPTYRDIADRLGLASINGVRRHLENLSKLGAVRLPPKGTRRGIVLSRRLPYLGQVGAGGPFDTFDDLEWETIDLNELFGKFDRIVGRQLPCVGGGFVEAHLLMRGHRTTCVVRVLD